MEFTNIKSIGESLEKAYSEGVYVDNPKNRKLGRVGMSYRQYKEKLNKEVNEKDGYWEEFVDEDTGEVVKIFRQYPSKKELRNQRRKKEESEKKYKSALIKEKKLKEEYYPLSNELDNLKEELEDKKFQYKNLQIDQEEEVGGLYVEGREEEAENLAQEYGEQFNQLDSEIEDLNNQIKELEPKVEKLWNEIQSIWDY